MNSTCMACRHHSALVSRIRRPLRFAVTVQTRTCFFPRFTDTFLHLPAPSSTFPQLPTGSQLLQTAASLLPPDLQRGLDAKEQLSNAGLLLDQLGSVFDEVRECVY